MSQFFKIVIALCVLLSFSTMAQSKKKVTYRKTQEVNFDGSDVDGDVRSPDGAYLVQKRGIQFLPLYKVKREFDRNIKDSVEYLR